MLTIKHRTSWPRFASWNPARRPISDVQKLVERYGGQQYDAHSYYGYVGSDAKYASPDPCLGEAMSYAVFANPPSIVLGATQALPALQRIGLHPWSVSLAIHQKGGVVTCYSQNVWFFRADGQEVEASANLNLKNLDSLVEHQAYEAMSFVSRNRYHHTRVDVLREASAEQKRRGFQMDLSCTVSLRGCYFPCQIVPLGWLDSVREGESHGRELPEGTHDPRCPSR